MGLCEEVCRIFDLHTQVLTCPKCLTFWAVLGYNILTMHPLVKSVAASFLSSYLALWLVLAYDALAGLYNSAYEKISAQEADTSSEAVDSDDSYQPAGDEVPEMQ